MRHSAARSRDQLEVGLGAVDGGVDVEDDEFVGLLLVEDLDRVDRVADVLRVLEADRLDEAAVRAPAGRE